MLFILPWKYKHFSYLAIEGRAQYEKYLGSSEACKGNSSVLLSLIAYIIFCTVFNFVYIYILVYTYLDFSLSECDVSNKK